jgi:elongation factor P
MFEGNPVDIELPSSLTLEVVETEPAMAGATKTAMTKPAKLANGVMVQVPPFVNQGELVRVDPRDGGKYLERAK